LKYKTDEARLRTAWDDPQVYLRERDHAGGWLFGR